ncbi:class I SAM-dependent methyltransferase [Paenactinomyces guangxiensis]|uniref:SAM-dependent methyltransferase n=1 Tax=Paenactinomyces guangxiensis TaxID=1490290 RepID=A0A7W1WQM6_9BACL|nr:SAM-dependent methyltransferase [Paenactinomyces guangxiensis]MBA4494273.1 SAM-dependent methyltransferase [Paenactinomyces guangxiensis]MBH8590767.1 SAM-dependent methyltransferase [Paenactinomyces guangxiensis]
MARDLLDHIINEINREPGGAIPFSRYMELALYHPEWGYYNREHPKLGRDGDFFTNAHVGDIFGQVLSRYFLSLRDNMSQAEPWALVEMGAGDGRLTEQMVQGLLGQGQGPEQLHLYVVEISPYHRRLQQERLAKSPFLIRWVEHIREIPVYPFSVIYSNELVDAFPVHQIKKEKGQLCEGYVAWDSCSGKLVKKWGPLSTAGIYEYLTAFHLELADGQTIEVNLAAHQWLQEVATWMKKGYLCTIDYGGNTDELLQRRDGTLRSYRRHQLFSDPLSHPGEMDITSHVNFEALQKWGERWGLATHSCLTQSRFLLEAGILDLWPPDPVSDPFGPAAKRSRAIRQLIHPRAMGEQFLVLLQGKN